MKKALALLVSLSLLAQCMLHVGIIGYYQWNKARIARELCVNRDKPQLKCCGKCYLKKQLNKAGVLEHGGKHLPARSDKEESTLVYILPPAIPLSSGCSIVAPAVRHPVGQHLLGVLRLHAVFHPPSC